MLKIPNNRNLFSFCLLTFVFSLLVANILPQSKDKTTNWPEPVFEHLTIANGLPENSVNCILQDHLGYMWFGTHNGLVRYDGYSMKVYQPDQDDSLSLSDNQIVKIYEDRTGTLWIGTLNGGLNKFDRIDERFTRYNNNPLDSTSISSDFVWTIYEDEGGSLFIGTDKSLDLFNRQTGSFKQIYTQDAINVRALIKDTLTGNLYVAIKNKIMIYDPEKEALKKYDKFKMNIELGDINSFFQSDDGIIWIGHSRGLAKFNSFLNIIKDYQPKTSQQYITENDIGPLVEDERGLIWGGGFWYNESNPGLLCFDPKKQQFKIYKHIPWKLGSLSDGTVRSIYKDRSGVLWVGTEWQGLNKWCRSKNNFKHFNYDSNGKRFNIVSTILEDKEGIIWIGTSNGLYSFNRLSNEFRQYSHDQKNTAIFIIYIYLDETGIIWCATASKGLARFDRMNGSFHFYSYNPNDSMSISHNYATCIQPEERDVLWVSTWGGGLNKFDKKTGKFTRFKHDPVNPQSLSGDLIFCLSHDRRGNLWIGTFSKSLNLFDRNNESFKSFNIEQYKSTSILTMYEDHEQNFWLGTYDTGLYLFDRDSETLVYNINVQDGLSLNLVRSILEDDSGNLWISTDYGLSKFDPETHVIRNYYTSDIFAENRYWHNCACKTSTGEMLFGTYDGFTMFFPDGIKDDPVPPQVVISNISLFNRQEEKLDFDGFISEMKELDLSYDENDLRFDYVGLQFADPSKNRYKYKLEGFDNDWIDAGTQRNATYTNLDAGEYTFKVKACNADGVWNEEGASLKIIIPPPFWKTWWAYGFYIIVFISVLYGARRYEMNRVNWKNQSKLDEVKLKEREETDRMKSRFFANISHEFRTPLTLILGPSESIVADSKEEETKKKASTIKRNAKRLLGLINQLLDLSKLEAGKLDLKVSKSNIVPFIRGITMSFESVAERKDITLKVKSSDNEIEVYFDRDKLTKIMTNLLSNAFKFTPEDGEIIVSVRESQSNNVISKIPPKAETEKSSANRNKISPFGLPAGRQGRNDNEGVVEIKVRDTGVGISDEELPKLFDRFYQVDSSQTRDHEGTGIGLALTKDLVELHHGTISVESKLGSWTEFTVTLPVGREHLKDEEIVEEISTEDVILNTAVVGMKNLTEFSITDSSRLEYGQASQAPQNDNKQGEDKNIILIVEDNRDVREFIIDSLRNEFQIEEASNGEMGVRKARQIIPDLIISDIMMPQMDGNELTKRLKNDEKTSHIPIILLTAKSEQQSKLEGLETGADDYLIKPFDTNELLVRIKNLIDIRRKLQEKFAGGRILQTKGEKKLSKLDENFLSKVLKIVEKHLAKEDFSIEQFGEEVGMSRMQLHRKLKALTGKSASIYLRSIRLNKAKQMIEEKQGNISEIAYSVGFSSPTYFTKCYKEEFGHLPSELLN